MQVFNSYFAQILQMPLTKGTMFSRGTTTSSVKTLGASFAVAPKDERLAIHIFSSSSTLSAVCT